MRSNSGFTLIELMIAIGVIAILVSVSTPAIIRWLPNYRLKSAARDLYSNFQKAKMQAVKENRNIVLSFDSSSSPGFYYFDMDNDGFHNAGETRVNLVSYGSGIDYGTGNATTNWNGDSCNQAASITFNSRGTSNARTVYIDNQNNDICYAITTMSSGSIKLRKYGQNNWY